MSESGKNESINQVNISYKSIEKSKQAKMRKSGKNESTGNQVPQNILLVAT